MNKKTKRIKVLVVDDEVGIRELLSEILVDEGYAVVTAHDATSAHQMRMEQMPDIILLDIWMPDLDGISLLRQWNDAGFAKVPVVVMSGHATIEMAVEAVRLGALEVLEKPITINQLLKAMEKAKIRKGKQESNMLLQQMDFGSTPAMKQFKQDLLTATADPGLLTLHGKLNCGAVFYAHTLARPQSPVVVVDNGQMLEGGVGEIIRRAEDGVIIVRFINVFNTIQKNGFLGLVREANKGEARVVAISAEHPDILAEQGEFSDTLIALLSRRVVEVPSLMQCKADLPLIINMICERLAKDNDSMRGRSLTAAAVEALAAHHYEEDFAELVSVIRTVFLSSQGAKIEAGAVKARLQQLALYASSTSRSMFDDMHNMPLREARECFEREYFTRLINFTNGNMQQAAKIAGLERTYFYRKLKQYKEGGGDGG